MSRALQAAFVVTVSTLTACDQEPPRNPPPRPVDTEQEKSATAAPSEVVTVPPTNPPKPQPAPKASAAATEAPPGKLITMAADGSCSYLHVFEIECEPGATCNPPEPERREVACPEIPAGTRVEKTEGTTCLATWFPKCPENTKCNPPPVKVELPCDKAPTKPK
jgi:hypothetical protein